MFPVWTTVIKLGLKWGTVVWLCCYQPSKKNSSPNSSPHSLDLTLGGWWWQTGKVYLSFFFFPSVVFFHFLCFSGVSIQACVNWSETNTRHGRPMYADNPPACEASSAALPTWLHSIIQFWISIDADVSFRRYIRNFHYPNFLQHKSTDGKT